MMKPSAASAEARFGANPPSSPTLVLWPASASFLRKSVEDFGAGANRLGHRGGTDRHHHEFLNVDRVVGMNPAVDDVHHRHRQGAREDAADIAVERLREVGGGRLGAGEADAEDRVGAEPGLVRRAVELDQHAVERQLVLGVEAGERIEDLAVDRSRPPAARPFRQSASRRRASRSPHARRSRPPTEPLRGRSSRYRA